MSTEPTSWNDAPLGSFDVSSALPERLDLTTLVRQQGVSPIADTDALHGSFWPADETLDDFLASMRASRRDAKL